MPRTAANARPVSAADVAFVATGATLAGRLQLAAFTSLPTWMNGHLTFWLADKHWQYCSEGTATT